MPLRKNCQMNDTAEKKPQTMIEMVARSLCSLHYEKRFDAEAGAKIVVINVEGNWHLFSKEAIRAIAAMRNPTGSMVDAALEERSRLGLLSSQSAPMAEFKAMINAALKEEKNDRNNNAPTSVGEN